MRSPATRTEVSKLSVVKTPHYQHPGRPKQNEPPTDVTYRATATLVEDKAAIERAKRKAGRFIIATNIVDDSEVTPDTGYDSL